MIILALDPGYDRLGWAVGELSGRQLKVAAYGLVTSHKQASLAARYVEIDAQLVQIIHQFQPDEAALETLFFSKNTTTALQVAEVRGVLLSCLVRQQVLIHEYNPNQIKLTVTGTGRADKAAVEKMVRMQLGSQLPTTKVIDDTIDALAILLTHTVLRSSYTRNKS